MDQRAHWETIHREKAADAVSWYRPHLDVSLQLIEELASERTAAILDVGAGQSTLVDDLVHRGYEDITVLDIAASAIDACKTRLGKRAATVRWVTGDVTRVELKPAAYDVWHDRAVFHFLTNAENRSAYVGQLMRALKPGGHVIVATFAKDGPAQCSGLHVVRYDTAALEKEFGAAFRLVKTMEENHPTPFGTVQPFFYGCFRMQ